MTTLTDVERETLLCDCKRYEDDPHGEMCSTRMEYDTLLEPRILVERVEAIVAARLREAAGTEAVLRGEIRRTESALATFDDVVAERDAARVALARVEALAAMWQAEVARLERQAESDDGDIYDCGAADNARGMYEGLVRALRTPPAALAPATTPEGD